MRRSSGKRIAAALFLVLALSGDAQQRTLIVRMRALKEGSTNVVFELHGLDARALQSPEKPESWKIGATAADGEYF